MRKFFSKTVWPLLLLSVILSISFAAAGCGNSDSPSDKGTPPNGDSTYTITFQTGVGGPTVAPIVSKAGAQITAPSPKRDGYRFDGWTLNGETYVISAMPEQSLTLVAAWTKLYTVTFITGANDITALYAPGEAIEVPTVSRDGYKFIEWKLNGQTYVAGEMPNRDITISAAWERTFTIAFNTGTDEYKIAPITDVAGAQIQAPAVSRFGYYLEYWTLNGSPYKFSVMPNNNITLVAKWKQLTNLPAMFIDLADADGNAIPLTSITRDAYVDSTITITNTDD